MAQDGCFNAGQGRKCTGGVWRAEVRAKAEDEEGRYIILLWGLVKAVELVSHQLLVMEAFKSGFPI